MDDLPLLRSYLYAPGSNDRILGKILDRGADAVVLDLEDAVAWSEKASARARVAAFIPESALVTEPQIHVRINRTGDGFDTEDLRAVVVPGLAALRLPKSGAAEEIRAVDELLSMLEPEAGLPIGHVALYPAVESATGVLAAGTLAAASPRVARFAFGATDFLADIGARGPADGEATLHARSRLVLASRAAAIGPPIDSVHTTIDDIEGLRRSAERARDLGFFGKSLIHPSQIQVVHQVFTSTAEELERARDVVAAFEEAAAEGRAATVVAGEFVDPAVVARSRALLRLAKRPVGNRGRT